MTDTPTDTTPLSTLIERRSRRDGVVDFVVTPDWMQGRTTFGGLIAALALQAARDVTGGEWPLRVLQASFIGPVGGETSIDVRLLRKGKNMKQVQATVTSSGQVAAIVLAAFGAARETAVPERLPRAPALAIAEDTLVEIPFMPGVFPNFLQHLRSRWAEGEFPGSGTGSWHSRIIARLKDESVDGELASVLLADLPPTPVLSFLEARKPASSVSWELEMLPRREQPTEGWYRVDTEVLAAAEGYVNQRTQLFAPDGELAAVGYQLVGIYG